jgi:hypothetical protein
MKEKEIFEKINQDNLAARNKFEKKKEAEKELFNKQIELYNMKEAHKKENHMKELEHGKECLQEFDKIMEKQEKNRIDMKNQIKERAKVQELRQKLVTDVREVDNYIKQEIEKKYNKERNEIENRTKIINDFNFQKRQDLISDMKKTLDLQKEERLFKEKEKHRIDNIFDQKVKSSYNDYLNEKNEKEQLKKMKIMKYKEELDQQLREKERNRRPIMDDTEKKLNKDILAG